MVGCPQPDALSTRPTRAADHDDDDDHRVYNEDHADDLDHDCDVDEDLHCGITLVNAMMMTLTR